MSSFLAPVVLEGRHVRLEPLTHEHAEGLREATLDGELWKVWVASAPQPDKVTDYIDAALAKPGSVAFAVRLLQTDKLVGMTRLYDADAGNRHVTIGYTWYANAVHRTAVNTECKWLLLRHAFETMHCIRVQWHTHWLNRRSRAAIERLGAKMEGVLRNHRILDDGSYRDTVVYSVIEAEWPSINRHLQFELERNRQST